MFVEIRTIHLRHIWKGFQPWPTLSQVRLRSQIWPQK